MSIQNVEASVEKARAEIPLVHKATGVEVRIGEKVLYCQRQFLFGGSADWKACLIPSVIGGEQVLVSVRKLDMAFVMGGGVLFQPADVPDYNPLSGRTFTVWEPLKGDPVPPQGWGKLETQHGWVYGPQEALNSLREVDHGEV
jgi:hypothetical protein